MKMRWLLAVVGLALATLPAAAQAPVSDTVFFFQRGQLVLSFPLTETGEGGLTTFFLLLGVSPTGNPAQYGSYTVLTEPDGTISDVMGVVPGNVMGTFNLAFSSDAETGLTMVPSAFINPTGAGTPVTMPEGNGGPFDVTQYLSPTLQNMSITATFQSDAEGVPEPTAFALLGIGGLGLVGYAWRRRQMR